MTKEKKKLYNDFIKLKLISPIHIQNPTNEMLFFIAADIDNHILML